MHFITTKAEILKAVNTVSRATSKFQKTILECILFICEGNTITLKATDISISIKTAINAEIMEDGQAAIPARYLHEIISKFPESDIEFKSAGDNNITISCQNSKVSLQSMNPDEFPEFSDISTEKTVKIKECDLKEMINGTIFAASLQEDKPILTGIMFSVNKDALEVVALDGYRMAIRKKTVISEVEKDCVIPAKTMREISRIIDDTEKTVKFSSSGSMALFDTEDTQVITRLLDGEYVKYNNLMPKVGKTTLIADREMLLDSIERAAILAREGNNNLIKMDVKNGSVSVTSNSEVGNIKEDIPVNQNGEDILIAFNAKYFIDVLKCIDEQEIIIELNTAISPCVIKSVKGLGYSYLVLPVQIRE